MNYVWLVIGSVVLLNAIRCFAGSGVAGGGCDGLLAMLIVAGFIYVVALLWKSLAHRKKEEHKDD
ncbi:MAG: hypothetical protein MPK31_08885 [Gammaproteobacteria bacterium]|nr:hypothetical protein [Gammaproteobacteria bacterium]MDA8002600.1 hypothetical protein [Alphaproteobacteria bacterium]